MTDHIQQSNPPQATIATHEHYDPVASKMGMWLFLFTEALLFGIMFLCYAVYLTQYTADFRLASQKLVVPIGAVNTLILLTSSLSMALSIAALQRNRKSLCMALLSFTVLCALAFLVIKGFEWSDKFHHGIYPGSPIYENWPHGQIVFFGLYYLMTGIHALHIIIGIIIIAWAMCRVRSDKTNPQRIAFLDNAGLYWHLVDLIWIYLFPLFYLIS